MAERAKFEKYTIAFTVYVLLCCVLLAMKFLGCGPWAPAKAMDPAEELGSSDGEPASEAEREPIRR